MTENETEKIQEDSKRKNYSLRKIRTLSIAGVAAAGLIAGIIKGPEYIKIFHPEYRSAEIESEKQLYKIYQENYMDLIEKRIEAGDLILKENNVSSSKDLEKLVNALTGELPKMDD